ncbi:glycerophosphodiester phosphodiesterase family protein [Hutsoniella sourekii]|uniref:glycerophosphodiester phosphodiesterase family protein n=1 Tax=Hutsoniella sourekii TaxID=87650 RepID=UPI000482110E|nr:glycerophosphodiester phosphodiesterase family protein [Hutsoniella sourekii]
MYDELLDLNNKHPFLILTHRGLSGGNVIQNTRQAVELAVKAGSDLVEVDICRSKDGEYYLFHNGMEIFLLGRDRDFSEWTSQEIDAVHLLNSNGEQSGHFVEKLEDFLDWLPEGYLVNLDRSFDYWEDEAFFNLIRQSGKQEQVLLKSGIKPEYLEAIRANGEGLQYIGIAHQPEEIELLTKYSQYLRILGVELIFKNLSSPILQPKIINSLSAYPIRLVNMESLGQDYNLAANITDDQFLFEQEAVIQDFIDRGINMIQTDWPYFLSNYRSSL